MTQSYPLDPQAKRRHTWDWSKNLDPGDTIAQASVVAQYPGTTELDDKDFDDTTVSITYAATASTQVTCHIVTAGGFEDDSTIYLSVQQQ